MSWDKDHIESLLSPADRRRIFEELGFYFNGHRAGSDGWINGVLGPKALGEGDTPNFAVNTDTGAVKDHGSSGYTGSLYDAVKDVEGLTFPEALEWIAGAVGLSEPSERTEANSGASNEKPTENDHQKKNASTPSQLEPAASLEAVAKWHGQLMDNRPEARAARDYLFGRDLSAEILREARIGLSRKPGRRDGAFVEWWIVIPIPSREHATGDDPVVAAVKGFAFDPEAMDWKRNRKGHKIARNASSALYDLTRYEDRPVLLCEGELDALCATVHGFNAVTGTNGAGTFKAEWARYLAGLTPVDEHGVVICFDGDDAGRKGAPKAASTLHAAGVHVSIATLPEGQDVSDVLQAGGAEALKAHLDAAREYKPEPTADARSTASHSTASHSSGTPEKNSFPPSQAPPIPSEVYDWLPPLLRETSRTFTRTHERDVYLVSALAALSACMPGVGGYYGETPNLLRPNLYLAVVAGAAGGKSAMRFGRWLTEGVNAHIKGESERALQRWEDAKDYALETDEPFDEPKPPEQSLILPANTSAAAFHEGLKNRNERALVVETEIDTLTNALGQEWGKFDDTLRKAYHHEPASYRRKGDGGNVTLEAPKISVVLSGTPHQFQTLMGSTENGLYSRFGLYYFEAPEGWISQRPSAGAIEAVEAFRERHGERVLQMWKTLARRTEPLRFQLPAAGWKRHDDAHRDLMGTVLQRGWGHLADVVKRAGVVAFRIAMVCAVLRTHSERPDLLQTADVLDASERDVELGVTLATTLADHSLRYAAAHLSEGSDPDPWFQRVAVMLNGVGETFSSGAAYDVAEDANLDVSERTLRSDLKRAARQGLIHPVHKNGRWAKGAALNGGASDAADAAD